MAWHGARTRRRSRPWLAMIAVPLAMNVAALLETWWLWPPLFIAAWWWADRSYRWTWIVAVEAGTVGTAWVWVGALNLGRYPDLHTGIAIGWVAYAVALAGASHLTRHHGRRAHDARY